MRQRPRHPFDAARAGSWLRLRVSLHHDAAPTSGLVDPPFRWEDVLDGRPPGEAERGPPAWCVPGPQLLTAGERLENVLLVRVLERGLVEVEDRLALTRRALAPVIETEREVVGARIEGARAAAKARAEAAPHAAATAVHHAHAGALGAVRAFTRGVATLPDRLANAARRAQAFLATPEGRERFRRGVVNPTDLTAEQKAVTLFVGMSVVAALLVVAHFAVTLAVPDLARPWRTVFLLFLYAFVTSIGAPFPIEPVLVAAALAVGPIPSILTALLAKLVAGWAVFFLGEEVNDRLRARAERSPRLARTLAWSERFAERYGVFATALLIATPGLPDLIALYVFSSLRMPLWKFLLGVGIGGLVLYTAGAYGGLAVVERVLGR